ncbi:MAG TPA: carboxypeptidase regulatory-like domain-containing protein [Pyrinomonadaceae bacterium]|nr:carboxypeptidase regulatory-like domain-containing protein [Pyrinomonadaceae bacterium]
MSTKRLVRRLGKAGVGILIFALTSLLLSSSAFAQVTASSAVSGSVSDQKGGVIKGATVTVTNRATGTSRTASTNDEGQYRLDLLPAGRYDVKVSARGFGDLSSENVELLVGRTSSLDFTLTPGTVSGTVTVTAGEAELISREKTDISLNITPRDVQDLPLNGRDLANLAYLAPGAKPVDSYDPTKNRIAIFGINGSSGRNVNVTVNGIDNKDNTVGGPVMQFPLESIQEFVISTQRFSAVNGRSEGGAVNVVTKSGGNDFHGSAFFQLRDKKLNATEVDPTTSQKVDVKPPFNRKIFGGSIGGPLYFPRFGEGGPSTVGGKRTFFFFAIERQNEATSIPVAADAFAELNLVTSLGAVPSPVIPLPYHDTRVNARIDHNFNSKHNIFLSYNDQSNLGMNDQSGQRNDLSQGNFTKNRLQLANVTLNSAFTSTVVNAATIGYQYWHNLIDTEKKVPTFFFGGGASTISFGTNTNVPQESYQTKYQFKDDLSITRGNHTFRTGFDYLWERKLGGFFEFIPTLELDFNDLPSVILSNPKTCGPNEDQPCYPQGFATPGAVGAMNATSGNPYFDLPGGAKMFGVYFQDDWKVRRNLTLNIGMRWDKDFNLIGTKAQGKSRTFLELKAINHPAAARLPHDDNKNFSPRVGFAWDIGGAGKHIVRGGYGLYFGQTFLNIPLFMIQQQNPTIFVQVLGISSGDIVPGTGILLSDWRFGIDALPTIPPPPTELPEDSVGRIMDPDYRNPYTQQWNVGYSYQINSYSVLEVDFVHVLGLHESKTVNINPTRNFLLDANGNEISSRPLTAAFQAAGVPVLNRIDSEQSVGRARYDGLNVSYRRRLYKNFTINATYTRSRVLSYNANLGAASFRNRASNPFDLFPTYDLGPTFSDSKHRFSMGSVFNLPLGFQIAPIVQWESARPYTASYGATVDILGQGGGRGPAHAVVFTSSPNDLNATLTSFGNPATSNAIRRKYRDCLRSGQCTFAGFANLRGQPFFQLDARVTKNFKIKERHNIATFIQFFDLTNRANFGNNFDGNLRNDTFGKPVGFITPSSVTLPHAFTAEIGVRYSF